ncbi:hypothetical protein MO867_18985 [Microbulbifer sp. OS29]|uniref:Uncharacterized protein n=1 Tax=Microbulbifer okhotskensis TaxID=2926617 RepID=A0A9X2EVW3_9GAMM|nr:hypothetical protein [Microbulbifer okhotskensis]MCO1336423.1 hypothetical protein [Microbulbifer okhotskensis]
MSQVSSFAVVFEEPNIEARKKIINLLQGLIPDYIQSEWGGGSGEGEVEITKKNVSKSELFAITIGGDGSQFFEYILKVRKVELRGNYFAVLYIEGAGIFVTVQKNSVLLFDVPLDLHDPDEIFQILESENYLEEVREAFIHRYFL